MYNEYLEFIKEAIYPNHYIYLCKICNLMIWTFIKSDKNFYYEHCKDCAEELAESIIE